MILSCSSASPSFLALNSDDAVGDCGDLYGNTQFLPTFPSFRKWTFSLLKRKAHAQVQVTHYLTMLSEVSD